MADSIETMIEDYLHDPANSLHDPKHLLILALTQLQKRREELIEMASVVGRYKRAVGKISKYVTMQSLSLIKGDE